MAQRSQVPKFGSWESEENVPYTAYFDNTRKGKDGGRMKQNEPQDNATPFQAPPFQQEAGLKDQMVTAAVRSKHEHQRSHDDDKLSIVADSDLHPEAVGERPAFDLSHQHYGGVRSGSVQVQLEALKGSDVLRPRHELRQSRGEGDLRRLTDSPLRHESVGRRALVDSPHHRHGGTSAGETPKRVSRQSAGSDRSIDHSPLHPHYQAKVGAKVGGVSSPSWERKGSSEGGHGLSPSTPGRSRLRSATRGDSPDCSPAVPKFGEWDENDPASAQGFTHIFNKVREEKQSGAGKVPAIATEGSYSNGQKQQRNDNSKSCCCCFPWGRK
ncbi:RPM1-interacting protein 4-like isoform X2 [Diospyros lotus]|uniref:RPM1-interacting protein 4-like isoform X2 n=1 Tax=Diospyros lotus TaxID=55363 RepID=UPI0022553A8F|nr:RPM1-interacting protein 4-like isoform X2 [Diospyros lotus]